MGFTPAAGLVMSTRTGDLDPGVASFLANTEQMTAQQFHEMVNHESGLLGVSGSSADMRDLLARETDDVEAAEAVALFCYQAKKWVGAYAAALGGLDTLVFSAGIGERSASIRARICAGLGFLGIDWTRSERRARRRDLHRRQPSRVRVIPTNEEQMIARAVSECCAWARHNGGVNMAAQSKPLSAVSLRKIDAYWRAANYLSVGQIYLYDNPLLRKPLTLTHVKPRLLGHWGTTPGLNFIYVHLNRVINEHDLSVLYVTGPGHGGPGLVANAYLEQTYSEVYPDISQDEEGMKRLFTQFSFPGGIPSHVAPETPGSIHEGGELGYSLSHAFGAAFDNPDLLVACVVGDGEARPVRWPPAGIRTSSSIQSATVPCCRSCT